MSSMQMHSADSAAKCALIVDDSKSARVVLSKMLEKYGLKVHAVDSAESAIAHLGIERPDVIFMDHLMPDMDGFQAVQMIKNDPRTAAIPIMMYTSQGGDLYIGQAKALGATGVLPKQMGLTDVATVLHHLHLLPERREEVTEEGQHTLELPSVRSADSILTQPVPPTDVTDEVAAPPSTVTSGPIVQAPPITASFIREALGPLFSAQSAELRRFMLATLDSQSLAAVAPIVPAITPAAEPPPPAAAQSSSLLWKLLCTLFLLSTLALGAYAAVTRSALQRAEQSLADAQATQARAALASAEAASPTQPADTASSASSSTATPPQGAALLEPVTQAYAYGQLPLGEEHLAALQKLVHELQVRGLSGTLTLSSYAADFCLTGNPAEGYGLAPEDMQASKCDLKANPFDASLRAETRQSRGFAQYLSSLKQTPSLITVEVRHAAHAHDAMAYPEAVDATAAQWNRAAALNQRVEFRFVPKASIVTP